MTLASSGAITLAQVNTEINVSPSTTAVSLNNTQVRNLAQKPSGAITLNDLHGKYQNNYTTITNSSNDLYYYGQAVDSSSNIFSLTYNATSNTYIVCKFNQFGTLQWQKQVSSGTVLSAAMNLFCDSSGNVYVAGVGNTVGATVIKMDSTGSTIWAKTYQFTSYFSPYWDNTSLYADKGYVDSSGNIYIPFYTSSSSTSYTKSAGFFKLDSNGTYLSNYGASFGTSTSYSLANLSMSADSTSSNFIFGGVWYPSVTSQGAIWKISAGGSLVWQKLLSYSNSRVQSTAVDSSGNVYATGSADNSATIFVAKLDSSGNLLWSRNITSNYRIPGSRVVILPNGNICVSGIVVTSGGAYNAVGFFVYNSSGTLLYQRYLYSSPANFANWNVGFFLNNVDAYNDVVAGCGGYISGSYGYINVLSKVPMIDNTNKLNTTNVGSNTIAVTSSFAGITESAGTLTLSNSSFSLYTQPTTNTVNQSLTPTTSSYTVSTTGMA